MTFGSLYLKTHVNMVISKMMFSTPNFTSNFETHKNVGYNFFQI